MAVCVTGASGFMASYLVKLLLLRGYTVHATVDILDPAVKGTLNALAACRRNPSVRRVVLTSSMAAVAFNGQPKTRDVVFDESWFSDPRHCDEHPQMKWYIISKIQAEQAAWKFCKENGIDMVSTNPGLMIGPMLQRTLNKTVALIWNLINGKAKTLGINYIPLEVSIKDTVENLKDKKFHIAFRS